VLGLLARERYAAAIAAGEKAGPEAATWVRGEVARRARQVLASAGSALEATDAFRAAARLAEARSAFEKTPHEAAIDALLEDALGEERAEARAAWKTWHACLAAARKGGKARIAGAAAKLRKLAEDHGDEPVGAAARRLAEVLGNPWTQADAAQFGGGICGG
jgi:hypothetical protein